VLVNGSKGDSITIHGEQSDLFGLECPPDEVVALPAERVFQWQQLGGGALNCFIDGALKNNAEEGCASPYTLNLKDTRSHTLTVGVVHAPAHCLGRSVCLLCRQAIRCMHALRCVG
jgi:hypothetical protein